jgi:ribosome-associated protein
VDSRKKVLAALEAALERKAYDLVVVEVEHLRSIADYFLIATGRSDIQVQAIARGIEERMDQENAHLLSIEGFHRAHWVVLDYDDVVMHIFLEGTREFYRLERTWTDAHDMPLPEQLLAQIRDLQLSASG